MKSDIAPVPYEDLPEETREYAKLLADISELGESIGPCSVLEDRRIFLHRSMAKAYGLRYEDTRDAVASVTLPDGFTDGIADERALAARIDIALRLLVREDMKK